MAETIEEQTTAQALPAGRSVLQQAVADFFRDPRFEELLGGGKLVLIDGGAKGGLQKEWIPVMPLLEVIAIEPLWPADIAERSEVASVTKAANKKKIYASDTSFVPLALAGERGSRSFYVTRGGAMSSFLRPDPRRASLYGLEHEAEIRRTVEVETTTLDSIVEEHGLRFVDFVKLDTQGSELEILAGGERTIGELAFGLRVETSFVPLYEGQPLFADVDSFVREQGFEFIDFTHLKRYRRTAPAVPKDGASRGQLVVADPLYFRAQPALAARLEELPGTDPRRYLAGAFIVCLTYSRLDYAGSLLAVARRVDSGTGDLMAELLLAYPGRG